MAELQILMPPPQHPVGTAGDWDSVEQKLGTRLPHDYKEFVRVYGAGRIGQMPIHISSPFSKTNNLQQHIDGTNAAYRLMIELGSEVPFPVFPERGGLLAWGNTGNGDYLNWLTKEEPDNWSVVVWDSADVEFLQFRMGMLKFLAEVISLRLDLFPADFLKRPLKYTSSESIDPVV
ncbi:MAG TPA: SMI1/KNR4 family protein [Gemmataceae bacterium]|nr:SMI1/KNR4 family protein [Gemmataceae bacterium]